MKKTILFLTLIAFFFLGCHKYQEDDFISLKRPWKRFTGAWQFTSYKIYGVEHSHDFDSLLKPRSLTDCCINFNPFYNLQGSWVIKDINGIVVHPADDRLTNYYFDEDRSFKTVVFGSDTSTFYTQLWKVTVNGSSRMATKWKIIELYSKELHINSNGVDIYFKKK